MYIKDGSKKDYAGDLRQEGMPLFKNLYAWRWLGDRVESRGWQSKKVKEEVIGKLKEASKHFAVDHFMGWHSCEICGKADRYSEVPHGSFSGSIKISHGDRIYCCPNGVEHYIMEHDYVPANKVIDAV